MTTKCKACATGFAIGITRFKVDGVEHQIPMAWLERAADKRQLKLEWATNCAKETETRGE